MSKSKISDELFQKLQKKKKKKKNFCPAKCDDCLRIRTTQKVHPFLPPRKLKKIYKKQKQIKKEKRKKKVAIIAVSVPNIFLLYTQLHTLIG